MLPAYQALLAVMLVSLLSFVGASTLFLKHSLLRRSIAFFVAVSVGALFGDAFIHLIPEAFDAGSSELLVSLSLSLGVLVFFLLEKVLRWRHSHGVDEESVETIATHSHDKKHIGWLVFFGDGLHNFLDGVIIAAGFLIDPTIGVATTIAVILHEIPQEIGDFGLLLHAGWSAKKALLMNFVSAAISILGALVVLLFEASFEESTLALFTAFAAGGFIYIAGSDLVPELHEKTGKGVIISQVLFVGLGFALMFALTLIE